MSDELLRVAEKSSRFTPDGRDKGKQFLPRVRRQAVRRRPRPRLPRRLPRRPPQIQDDYARILEPDGLLRRRMTGNGISLARFPLRFQPDEFHFFEAGPGDRTLSPTEINRRVRGSREHPRGPPRPAPPESAAGLQSSTAWPPDEVLFEPGPPGIQAPAEKLFAAAE